MKRFVLFIFALFICTVAFARTIRWHVGDSVYTTTTCSSGDSITPPTAPAKTGYNFVKWKLPYTEIEYLESTGTQWINTGIVPDSAIKVQTRIFTSVNKSARWNTFLGSNMANGTGAENFTVAIFTAVGHNFYMGYINDHNTGFLAEYDTWYNIEIESTLTEQYLKIDSDIIYIQHVERYPQTTSPIALFGCYSKDAGITWISPIKIGNTKFYYNNTLVRDFIPALDDNNIPCMYDKVTGQFFYNQGTGDFIAGPVVTE